MIYLTTTILLILFCVLGVFDGLYFHLYKYKLHLLPSARKEHLLHTARAFVFVPMSILLFAFPFSGMYLYLGVGLAGVDLVLELLDILEEKKSRAPLGGISSEESAIHVFASSCKFAAIVTILHAPRGEPYPVILTAVGLLFSAGCLAGGGVSLFKMRSPFFLRRPSKMVHSQSARTQQTQSRTLLQLHGLHSRNADAR